MVKPRKDDSISSKVIREQTEQFLELFSRTLRLKDVKISLCIIVLIVRTKLLAGLNKLFSRALPLHLNYDKLSRIFSCTLLICNHMIFLCNLE